MPQAKAESDTESQKQRQRQFEDQINPIRPKRRMLPIEDVPDEIRGVVGRTLNELPGWSGDAILSPIQQLKEERRTKGNLLANIMYKL